MDVLSNESQERISSWWWFQKMGCWKEGMWINWWKC